jgi:hypothetical protein
MRTRPTDPLPSGGISSVGSVQRGANTRAAPTSATGGSGPGVLDVSIRLRGNVVEMSLAGPLDMASVPRLGEAMTLARDMASTRRSARQVGTGGCRRRHGATIVVDTSDVVLVDSAGYRALQAELVGPNGLWDPGVAWIVGPAVATFEASTCAAPRAGEGGP